MGWGEGGRGGAAMMSMRVSGGGCGRDVAAAIGHVPFDVGLAIANHVGHREGKLIDV